MFVMYALTSGSEGRQEIPVGIMKLDNMTGAIRIVDSGKFTNYNTLGTKSVKTGIGVFQRIVINATLTGTVEILDDTARIALLPIGTTPQTLTYKAEYGTELKVILSAGDDVTVVYL